MSGRCVIFCAGERGNIDFSLDKNDFVICCDAGFAAARDMSVVPDLIMGDFDSYCEPLPDNVKVMRYPVEKDDTDSMLAVREGLKRGFTEFVLLFPLGGRLDHTIANIQTLAFLQEHGANGTLIGPRDTVRLLKNSAITLPRRENYTLSVFAFRGSACGVSLKGVQYLLDNAEITEAFPIGLGNHILSEQAEISVSDGTLIIIESEIN